MGQSEQFHEQWAYLRDNAKPCVPDDVFDLRAVREFVPPSKGHLRRIARVRPAVLPTVTRHPDVSGRAHYAQVVKHAKAVRVALGVREHHAEPLPYTRPAPCPPGERVNLPPNAAALRYAQSVEEARRLATYGCDNLSAAWRAYSRRHLNV